MNTGSEDAVRIVVMMGVSGSGKTSVGEALAERLGWIFKEGDELHPQANIDKMRSGHPLNDTDRAPWLDMVARWMSDRLAAGENSVISSSALKLGYRDRLRRAVPGLTFILLDPDPETLRHRVEGRSHHFMPKSLLDSQLATLERPGPEEQALVLPGTGGIDAAVERIIAWLGLDGSTAEAGRNPPRPVSLTDGDKGQANG